MNFLANKPLKFVADRYEEWSAGQCVSQGPIDAVITASVSKDAIRFFVQGADTLRMYTEGTYSLSDDSGDLGDRIQYVSPNIAFDPLAPIVCHIFHDNRTIRYIRFAMTSPDRIIEFYGKTVSFDGMERPEMLTGNRIPGLKRLLVNDLADQYRALLKGNTVSLAIIDHQMACVALSLRKYYTLVAFAGDPDGAHKDQVFKDVSSSISQFFPIFGNEALDDARNWFYKIAANPFHADVFLGYYYGQLDAGNSIDCFEIMRAFQLS